MITNQTHDKHVRNKIRVNLRLSVNNCDSIGELSSSLTKPYFSYFLYKEESVTGGDTKQPNINTMISCKAYRSNIIRDGSPLSNEQRSGLF